MTSRFHGVTYDARNRKWIAQLTVDRSTRFLARFDDELEAARAVDNARLGLRRFLPRFTFNRFNFPIEEQRTPNEFTQALEERLTAEGCPTYSQPFDAPVGHASALQAALRITEKLGCLGRDLQASLQKLGEQCGIPLTPNGKVFSAPRPAPLEAPAEPDPADEQPSPELLASLEARILSIVPPGATLTYAGDPWAYLQTAVSSLVLRVERQEQEIEDLKARLGGV